jgi:4a-hydroxytetrahydrobiopterin dehydratase
MSVLTPDDIRRRLPELAPKWTLAEGALTRTYVFDGFPEAVAFVGRLVPGAEHADHHPDVSINYKKVTLRYSTHSEGGVTDKDFAGARLADACAQTR